MNENDAITYGGWFTLKCIRAELDADDRDLSADFILDMLTRVQYRLAHTLPTEVLQRGNRVS